MPQTRKFRDRVVSMEQTFEGGEKHLELLKTLCREALPEFDYVSHFLDHERDLFVIQLASPDGRRKSIGWTRMVLFDAERIPVISGDPIAHLRSQIVQYLRARANRPEILVTFRHLEEGWVDTPEPRRERRRRRRGRGEPRAAGQPEKGSGRPRAGAPTSPRGAAPISPRGAPPGSSRALRPGRSAPPPGGTSSKEARSDPLRGSDPATIPGPPRAAEADRAAGDRPEGDRSRRRFRRRRRRGRGSGGGGSPGSPTPSSPA